MTAGSTTAPRFSPRMLRDGALNSLVAATGMIGIGGAMVVTTVSLFLANEVQATPLAIGLFFAGRAAAEIATDLIVGVLSDRIGSRRTLLAICSLSAAIGALSYVLLRDYYALFFTGAFFFGIGGATFPQLFAYTREFAEARALGVTFFNSALRAVTSAAWVLGPPLGFLLIGQWGFGVLYGAAALLYAGAGALCRWALPNVGRLTDGDTGGGTAKSDTAGGGGRGGTVARAFAGLNLRAGLLLAAIVLMLTADQMYLIDIALMVTRDLGFDPSFTGLLLGLAAVLEIPIMIGFGAWADRIGHWRLVLFATLCATAFFCLLPMATTRTELLLLQIPKAVWTSIMLSIPVVILQNLMPDRPGVASATYSSAFKAGAFLGGAVAGVVAAGVGFTSLFWVCGGLSALAAGLLIIGRK